MVGLQFHRLDIQVAEPGVGDVVLKLPDGQTLQIDVEVTSVPTEGDGEKLATQAAEKVCDRLAYAGCWSISTPVIVSAQFTSLTPPPPPGVHEIRVLDYLRTTDAAVAVVTAGPGRLAALRDELELASPPGEHNYWMFRAALAANDRVVQFMQLYHLLNMLHNDKQAQVDAFIVCEEPGVAQTPSPIKAGVMETLYTRLRNELAHKRAGVNLADTKAQMANYAPALARLTKRAIELHP